MYLGSTPHNTVLGGVMPYAAVTVVIMIFREMNPISITKKKARYSLSLSLGAAWAPLIAGTVPLSCPLTKGRRQPKGPFFFIGLQKPKTKFSSSRAKQTQRLLLSCNGFVRSMSGKGKSGRRPSHLRFVPPLRFRFP